MEVTRLSLPPEEIDSALATGTAMGEDYADWTAIKGIQLEGAVRLLAGREREGAMALYAEKFDFLKQPIAVVEKALAGVNWYCLSPSRVYFVDNSRGFGHRDEIETGYD